MTAVSESPNKREIVIKGMISCMILILIIAIFILSITYLVFAWSVKDDPSYSRVSCTIDFIQPDTSIFKLNVTYNHIVEQMLYYDQQNRLYGKLPGDILDCFLDHDHHLEVIYHPTIYAHPELLGPGLAFSCIIVIFLGLSFGMILFFSICNICCPCMVPAEWKEGLT